MSLTVFSLAVLFTSIGAGAVGAILGLGGGILLIPILTVFYGVDLHYAMGTSLVSVIATSSGAAAMYLRSGLSNIRIGLFLAMATVTGALIGAALSGVVPPRALELILGLALAYSVIVTLRQLISAHLSGELLSVGELLSTLQRENFTKPRKDAGGKGMGVLGRLRAVTVSAAVLGVGIVAFGFICHSLYNLYFVSHAQSARLPCRLRPWGAKTGD